MDPGRGADLRGARTTLSPPHVGDGGRGHFVILNPAAGRGRGARLVGRYLELLRRRLPEARHALTTRPGEEAALAERAVAEGFSTVVAVGGDGTWSHVADRLVACGRPGVRLAILPAGTGNDFGRSIGVAHGRAEEAVRILVEGRSRTVDVGRVNTPAVPVDGRDGARPGPRHFLNVVGFGFDIAVIDAARTARFLKGELLYKLTALQQLFRFAGFDVAVEGPDGALASGRHLMVTVSNGRYFGGGFPIAPQATVSDGLLHACLIADASPLERLRMFNLAEKGRHTRSPGVRLLAESRFVARFPDPPRFEVDGDVYRSSEREVDVELLPGALEVVAPE